MKTHLITCFFITLSMLSFGFSTEANNLNLNIGVGLPRNIDRILNRISSLDGMTILKSKPLYQVCISTNMRNSLQIGVVGCQSKSYFKEATSIENKLNGDRMAVSRIIGLKLEYSIKLKNNCSLYLGPTFVYCSVAIKSANNNICKKNAFGIYPHIGITRKFSKNTSGYLELGYGMALVNTGIIVRLK